jgi:hypothetical protein
VLWALTKDGAASIATAAIVKIAFFILVLRFAPATPASEAFPAPFSAARQSARRLVAKNIVSAS